MRAGSVGRWARAGADVRCASSAGSTTVVAVAVDTGIGDVRNLGAVSAVSTSGVIVTSCAGASVGASGTDTSGVAGGTDTGVGASRSDASSVTSRAYTSVGASRAEATGVTS